MKGKRFAIASMIAGILMMATMLTAGATFVGVGTVEGSGLRLRKDASTEADVITTANKGETVVVLEDKGEWYMVDFHGQVGYMSAEYVSVETDVEKDLGQARVTTAGDPLNLRSGAGTGYSAVAKMGNGALVQVLGVKDGWYKISYNGKEGYASSDYITLTQDGQTSGAGSAEGSTFAQSLLAEAMKHVGKRYVRGGKGPNVFDCSGFTYYCVKQVTGGSIILPATSTTQWFNAPGQRIYSMSEMRPGDLFFICDPAYSTGKATSHVAIYAGNGMKVHAANSKTGVVYGPLNDKDTRYFVGAIRLG